MKKLTFIFTLLFSASLFAYEGTGGLDGYKVGQGSQTQGLQRVEQILIAPPHIPKHVQVHSGKARVIQVRMIIEEKQIKVAEGAYIWAFTFNGSVPGPMIVAHVDDYIELTLVNPSTSMLPHNIDFHASTGAMGGGDLSQVGPGEEAVIRFKVTKPGVFVYHCAPGGPMVPWHVVHGMNGAIMVLPKQGLKDDKNKPLHYDRAYYIGEQDYYLPKDEKGNFKRYTTPIASYVDDLAAMRTLTPSHVVFNGAVGALTGDKAMRANVGETVLFVHSQANRPSYPHLIGGHGDYVWERGNFSDAPATNLESWNIAAGSAGAFIYTFKQPGQYAYLSHNLIEAFLFGAAAHIKVEGQWNNDLMQKLH